MDDSFPPAARSLFYGGVSGGGSGGGSGEERPVVQWLRPRQIRTDSAAARWTVFRRPQPSHIQQGGQGLVVKRLWCCFLFVFLVKMIVMDCLVSA